MCREFGWSIEYVENLTEIELYTHLENIHKIKKSEKLQNIVTQTRAVAAGMGDKKSQKSINKEVKDDEREKNREQQEKEYIERYKKGERGNAPLTFEEIAKIEKKDNENGR